jgi:hypothetical protein
VFVGLLMAVVGDFSRHVWQWRRWLPPPAYSIVYIKYMTILFHGSCLINKSLLITRYLDSYSRLGDFEMCVGLRDLA